MQMRQSLLIGMLFAGLWAATGFVQPVWGQEGGRVGRGGMLLRLMSEPVVDCPPALSRASYRFASVACHKPARPTVARNTSDFAC